MITKRRCVTVCCSALQCVAVCCSVTFCVCVPVCCCVLLCFACVAVPFSSKHAAVLLCEQYTATHCNTLQHAAAHCNTIAVLLAHFWGNHRMMTKRWCVAVCCSALQHVAVCCSVLHRVFVKHTATGWRRFIGSPKLQIICHKRATKYRSLLRKMTYKDKGSYESSPPCSR